MPRTSRRRLRGPRRAVQRVLTEALWPTEPVINCLQAYLSARLNTLEGIFVLDESGFPKQGKKSVGVARQYCGALGKVGNCHLGVFLAYVSARGHALVDKRLYLPVPVDDGTCAHLPGLQVPSVPLMSTSGHLVDPVSLPGWTAVYCYPRTGRPDQDPPQGWDEIPGARGCTPQSCAFGDHYQDSL